MFTIEVKKKGKDEEFSFKNVLETAKVIHNGCYGGKAKIMEIMKVYEDSYIDRCYCERCGAKSEEFLLFNAQPDMIRTAIDGQERKITEEVRVIQRT